MNDHAPSATATPEDAQRLLALVGDPIATAAELARARVAASRLSSDRGRLIDEFPRQWVAVHAGGVVAAASLDELLAKVDQAGIDRSAVIVRFIDESSRVLIL